MPARAPRVAALLVTLLAATLPVTAGRAALAAAAASGAATSRYVPLAPVRILDTRTGTGAPRGALPPRGSVVLQATGASGVPADATAVVLNVTLTGSTGSGFVQVYPTGQATEGASSNLNVQGTGKTVPGLVVAPVGDGGRVTVYSHGGGQVLADLQGYFIGSGETAAGRYRALTPARLLDTRTGEGAPRRPLGRASALTLQVTGRGGVPSSGVAGGGVNVTATASRAAGFVQVVPSAGSTPAGASSNLNHAAGQTVANLVVVPVGDGGAVDIYSSSGTHVLADVAGWFTDDSTTPSTTGLFVPVTPARLLDTRSGSRPADGAQVSVRPLGQAGVPTSGVSSVVLTVTATLPAAAGFVQALPSGSTAFGSSSHLNLERSGQTVANTALATLGEDGGVTLYTLRSTHLLADVAGWFTGAAAAAGPLPAELQGLRVAERTTDAYDDRSWPQWPDVDGDCRDTRTEVLAARSVFEPTYSDDGCAVTQGLWTDAWTGRSLSYGSQATIAPLVPFQNATVSGAAGWTAERRQAYADDRTDGHLAVVSPGIAADRAGRGPEAWQPPLESSRCGYARSWAAVKRTWDLTVTSAELEALRTTLATC